MNGPLAIVDSSAELGGAELSLLPVVERCARSCPVVAFVPAHGPLEGRLEAAGARVSDAFLLSERLRSSSPGYRQSGGVMMALEASSQQWHLAGALRALRPRVVYCNGFRAQLGATLPALTANAIVVWHVRDFARSGAQGRLWKILARRVQLIIANSQATARQPALQPVSDHVVPIPNGIDLHAFRQRAAEPPGAPVLGMAAHLTPWKGHERFLRVLRRVRDALGDVRGRIAGAALYDTAGNRNSAARLAAEIHRLGLRDVCTIESVLPERMPEWFAGLTVLVHCPDRPEPFGRALAEALAVGVPVVLAGAGGACEVVGEAGIIVEQGDEEALVRALQALLTDPVSRETLGRLGPARAAAHFDERRYADDVAARLLAL